ncbi:hypothetical protein [Thiolapillus sp.]
MGNKTFETKLFLMIVSLSAASLSGIATEGVAAEDDSMDWQMQQIYHPGKGLLQREQRGLVTIYDGFTDVQVDHALDRNFPRMGNMMFTRIKTTDRNGKILRDAMTGEEMVEEDGCDD